MVVGGVRAADDVKAGVNATSITWQRVTFVRVTIVVNGQTKTFTK
jgi:hypothetical protein